jgi:hypothetical protein
MAEYSKKTVALVKEKAELIENFENDSQNSEVGIERFQPWYSATVLDLSYCT